MPSRYYTFKKDDIEFFALGCHGPWKEDAMPEAIYTLDNHDAYIASQDKYIRNYASATQMFWVAWKQHMGCDDCDDTTKTKLFIDSAMSQKNWVNSTSGAGDGEYNTWGDGVSAWNYKPTGLDQGGAANGTLGRVIFSTLSKVGWTGNALRAEFKSRMMAQGTVFKFKNDPNFVRTPLYSFGTKTISTDSGIEYCVEYISEDKRQTRLLWFKK